MYCFQALPARYRGRIRPGVTLIELLIVITIIATLVAMLSPAIMQARQAANALICKNHFRQIGTAIQNYELTWNSFPSNKPIPWPLALMPFLGRGDALDASDSRIALCNSPQNSLLDTLRFEVFLCPAQPIVRVPPKGLLASCCAANAYFLQPELRPAECRDRLGIIALVIEITSEQALPITSGPTVVPSPSEGVHAGCIHVLMLSGEVRTVPCDAFSELATARTTPYGHKTTQFDFLGIHQPRDCHPDVDNHDVEETPGRMAVLGNCRG